MSKGFVQIRRGLEDHLLAGRLSLFEAGAYLVIHLQADYKTGIWTGSAPRLLATASRGASLRDVQRAISRLEKIGFLRVFHRHGQRGNYKVLIHKYEPQSGALKGQRLNALASNCWRNPVYESCAETDSEADTVPVAEAAPYLKEERKKDGKAAPHRPRQDTRSSALGSGEEGRLFHNGLKKLAAEKTYSFPNKPAEPLRGDLHGGIHWKRIEKVFFDAQRLPFEEQLATAVGVATTDLALNRTGKMLAIQTGDVEKLAVQKLSRGRESLRAISDFTLRARSSRDAVGNAVISAAAELLEGAQAEVSV